MPLVLPTTIRVAVVGAGPAGQAHAFGWRNATMADRLSGVSIELDTIVDPNIELAKTVARRYGFRNAVADVQEVIENPAIDAVSAALPNYLSVPVLSALLRAGKHVLGEKPLGR
ncbi:MAG: Gfo/Idh/MocA family oxidoreductase, partial [Propionibacteriaceae bacterium]|nr:Gfo/Idh/MocA family oxidoreductase [Propionibacteriaceae bacterium]